MVAVPNTFNNVGPIKRYPSSGLSILIVGGGIAGLGMAIEGYRKGHDVRVIDRRPNFEDYGDIIGIGDSVLKTMKNWPGFLDACYESLFPREYHAYKFDSGFIGKLGEGLGMCSSLFHSLLHQYTMHLGIPIRYAAKVVDYFETDDHAGVVGTPFENMNTPPGHIFKLWTVSELLGLAERGEKIVDDGGWS
ncbi:hypothetical protein NW767_011055 [Fusarium falciforme]|nr:hypothetical protein NW767_011055 [Fusarium falciforme]